MNPKRFSIYIALLGPLILLTILASNRTLDRLVEDLTLFGPGNGPVKTFFIASVVIFLISTLIFGLLVHFSRSIEKKLNRTDLYFIIIVIRLGISICMEFLFVKSYGDLPDYLGGGLLTNAPVTASYLIFLRLQQELVFSLHGTEFLPDAYIYSPMIIRLNNLLLEVVCIYLMQRVLQFVKKPSRENLNMLSHLGGINEANTVENNQLLVYYLIFPFSIVIGYIWTTVDFLVLLVMLFTILQAYNKDFLGLGIGLGLCFLVKYHLALFIIPHVILNLKKKDFKTLMQIFIPFAVLGGGVYFIYFYLTGTQSYMEFLLQLVVIQQDFLFFPYISNVWVWVHQFFPPILIILSLAIVLIVAYFSFKIKSVSFHCYVVIFSVFAVLIFAFAPWWVSIYAFFYPFYLIISDGEIKKRALIAFSCTLIYFGSFLGICTSLLVMDPNLGQDVVTTLQFFLEWPYFLWIFTGYLAFVLGHIFTIQVGLHFQIELDKKIS